jgi:hypothetical protein
VKSYLTEDFIKLFEKLPERIQNRARYAYKQWKENPFRPNLQFKKVHQTKPIYSVRVNIGWRALGFKEDEKIIWFWVGSHESYNKIISQL